MERQNLPNMTDEDGRSFDPRYLAAKKSIDDRSLNHQVWQALCRELPQSAATEPARIVEIGAGIGTMFQRIVDRGLLTGPASYLVTDSDPRQLDAARQYLGQWAKKRGHLLSWMDEQHGRLQTADADIQLTLKAAGAEQLAGDRDQSDPFHLLIAHAVLDLIDFPFLLPQLISRLRVGGLAYLTCNFDGETIFLPEAEDDRQVVDIYHGSMEARLKGASHTGRRLLSFLQQPNIDLLAAGSSDWFVFPRQGVYREEENFFLHTIIDMVAKELAKKGGPQEQRQKHSAWVELRHRQVAAGELTFIARHIDLLARRGGPSP